MIYFIVFVLVIIIVLTPKFFGVLGGLNSSNPHDYHLGSIKSFLGYNFKGEYNIIEFHSNEFHPDHPVKISILLSDKDFDQVKMYLQTIDLKTTETRSRDGKVSYMDSWVKEANIYTKSHEAFYVDSGYTFFIASLEIDCDNSELRFSETGI